MRRCYYLFVSSEDGHRLQFWSDSYEFALSKLVNFRAGHRNAVGSIMGLRLKGLAAGVVA